MCVACAKKKKKKKIVPFQDAFWCWICTVPLRVREISGILCAELDQIRDIVKSPRFFVHSTTREKLYIFSNQLRNSRCVGCLLLVHEREVLEACVAITIRNSVVSKVEMVLSRAKRKRLCHIDVTKAILSTKNKLLLPLSFSSCTYTFWRLVFLQMLLSFPILWKKKHSRIFLTSHHVYRYLAWQSTCSHKFTTKHKNQVNKGATVSNFHRGHCLFCRVYDRTVFCLVFCCGPWVYAL